MIKLFLTAWFILSTIINFGDLIYRIITEKEKVRSWKQEAITDLFALIIDATLLFWIYLSWW